MFALLLALLAPAADADQSSRFAGRLVSSVVLVAGEGELPEADLEPLLRVHQGDRLDLSTIQLDLRTLYRVAPIAAVQAHVSDAPIFDPAVDDVVAGVALTYYIYPATRVAEVRVQGADRVAARRIAGGSRLRRGDPFDAEQDADEVAERVQDFLVHEGFPDATVEVEAYPDRSDPFSTEVWIRVNEGSPTLVGEITVDGIPAQISDRQVRRWLRSAGLKTGVPLAEDALTRARLTVRQRLARIGGDGLGEAVGPRTLAWLRRAGIVPDQAGGWVEAAVRVTADPVGGGTFDVHVQVEPGPRLTVRTEGMSVAQAQRALDINERLRLTRGFVEQADDRIVAALAEGGYAEATAEVWLDEGQAQTVLNVRAETGPRHRRRPVRFAGNEALSAGQLRSVLNQASPEVLRRRRWTEAAMTRALGAAQDLYHSIGYAEATLTAEPVRFTRRYPILSLDRAARWAKVSVRVQEGPVTTLQRLTIAGSAPEVPVEDLNEVVRSLEGGPFSPQGLQSLAQRLAAAHRAQGYLEAEAVVDTRRSGESQVEARITVSPGDRVLLRSFATRGNRRVDSPFLRRTVAPNLGEPLTSALLDQLRQNLYDMGMFSGLELSVLGDGPARDLVVDLQERRRHTVEAGLGLASDQGIRALGRWTFRNVLGPADRLDTNALLGLRFASGTGWLGVFPSFRTPEYRLGTNYSTPLTATSRLTISLVGLEQIQERNWRSLRRAVGVVHEWRPTRSSRLQIGGRLEFRRLADADPGTLLANDVWASDRLALPPDPSVDTRGRLVDLFEVIWLDDRRDNPLQPTRGVLFSARAAMVPALAELARPGDTASDNLRVPTAALEARAQSAIPIGRLSLRLSAEAGYQRVIELGAIHRPQVDGAEVRAAVPVEQRYRLGGTASLRGFRRDGVGPRQKVRQLDLDWPAGIGPAVGWQQGDSATRWVSTGGDTYGKASIDLLIPLPVLGLTAWDGYELALFTDAGQVLLVDPDSVVTSSSLDAPVLRFGSGVGLRVLTPVGPLQADLAFNPVAIAQGPDGLLRREWEEPVARIHLSLGTLF